MTIRFLDDNGYLLRQFTGIVHVPRIKEKVNVKDVLYKVTDVTSVIQSDFTTEPLVVIQLRKV